LKKYKNTMLTYVNMLTILLTNDTSDFSRNVILQEKVYWHYI